MYGMDNSTSIEPATTEDTRPLSRVVPKGFLPAHYHELTELELSDALPTFTRTEIRVLTLAAKGISKKEICSRVGLKTSSLTKYLKQELFHDAYYTLVGGTGFTNANAQALAQSKAVPIIERLNDIATMPIDWDATKPAMIAQSVSASRELLTLGGAYPKSTSDATTINIGQMLLNLTPSDTPQWKR